jgi:iron complex transport system substrate-binding protein
MFMKLHTPFKLVLASIFIALFVLAACTAPPVPQLEPTAAPESTAEAETTAVSEPTVTTEATSASEATAEPEATTASEPTATGVATAQAEPTSASASPNATESASGEMTLTDSAGRTVTLSGVPSRIVSLAPSNTEIVCALGACDKLVGRDQFSDFPAEVTDVPVLSDGFNPNYEEIVAADPDLILVAAISAPDVISRLDELDLPAMVVGVETSSFDSVKEDIRLVAQTLGAEEQATKVVEAIDTKYNNVLETVAAATTTPRVFWELDATDPAKPYTVGPNTFVNEIINLAGGENIAASASSPYVQINAEEVIAADPEVIILSDAAYGVSPESVGQRPGWDVITAVQNDQVHPIDDNLVSRPGPRIADGLEAAAKIIHPELFSE